MKQIVFLFFTFLGIYTATAQDVAGTAFSDTIKKLKNTVLIDTTVLKKLPMIKLLSNPVRNKAAIMVENFTPGEVQVLLTDSRGNRLRDDRRLIIGGKDIITLMFSLPAGMYFITIKQQGCQLSKKLLVR